MEVSIRVRANHFFYMGDDIIGGQDVVDNQIKARLVFLSCCSTFTTYNTISTIANAFFQVGAQSVVTSYMQLDVAPATLLYTRLLSNLAMAAANPIHYNWLSFVAHQLRTSYIQAPLEQAHAKAKNVEFADLAALTALSVKSMLFNNRRELYKNLNTNSFTKSMGADYQYVVPHYLMYSILGRADLIRFEVSVENAQKQ